MAVLDQERAEPPEVGVCRLEQLLVAVGCGAACDVYAQVRH
jgi:hypothetical protein